MSKRFKYDESGDSSDLQALFDSIAGQSPARPQVKVVGGTAAAGDSPDLEALFDSIAGQAANSAVSQAAGSRHGGDDRMEAALGDAPKEGIAGDNVFQRIGHMTRQLHDTLRELGYDHALEEAAKAIPDARQRLAYVAQMTEQAASRVLNATDVARPIQDGLQAQAAALSGRWDRLFGGDLSVDEFRALAGDTRNYLNDVPKQTAATNDQLMEIMMAQDFQDLTGQVIKKVVDLAQRMESELLQVLIEAMPQDMKFEAPAGLMNGPVVNADGRTDVVNNQEQVDDLLESLGF
ncbi:MAG: protein phosphatase CheZ [Betaproteobacteria bacterium HGW-Betaproteobacteria-14]|nr:MAG: protein phosphatase CheZ [Betaproteobacteria bacterium HGW-Betaproteobacteria-14]